MPAPAVTMATTVAAVAAAVTMALGGGGYGRGTGTGSGIGVRWERGAALTPTEASVIHFAAMPSLVPRIDLESSVSILMPEARISTGETQNVTNRPLDVRI